jgi:hypothetical protein
MVMQPLNWFGRYLEQVKVLGTDQSSTTDRIYTTIKSAFPVYTKYFGTGLPTSMLSRYGSAADMSTANDEKIIQTPAALEPFEGGITAGELVSSDDQLTKRSHQLFLDSAALEKEFAHENCPDHSELLKDYVVKAKKRRIRCASSLYV